MRLTVLGSGDAFGAGGRLQAAFHFSDGASQILLDCGVTSMIGLHRAGLASNDVSAIYLSHLHGDHFGGLPWWLLDAQHVSRRTTPLLIAGPPGTEARFVAAAEALYPGSTKVPRRFDLRFSEYTIGSPQQIGPATVTAREVRHPSGAPSCALRLTFAGKEIGYSGDTEWVDALVPTAAGADLFLCECYAYGKPVPYHLDWDTIDAHLPELTARQVLLTHMNPAMLAQSKTLSRPRVTFAHDGLVLDF